MRILPEIGCRLAESPLWDDRSGTLYWVDIALGRLHAFLPAEGRSRSWEMGEKISCLGLTEGEDLLIAGVSGIWRFSPETGARELRTPFPGLAAAGQRPNDGKIGPDGAFWVGTMEDRDDRGPAGRLLRVAPDGGVSVALEGLVTPNGLEWSPDGRTMYLAETRALTVERWDFDPETGAISNRRPFVKLGEGQGKPDGAAVDGKGDYWVSGIYAGVVWGFSPEGEPVGSFPVGAEMSTMPCFGGADLDQLYVTSLSRTSEPEGGLHLLERTGLQGRPARRARLR